MGKFLEIFTKSKNKQKKTKQLEKTRILIDYRERNCLVGAELIKMDFEVQFKELKVADYIVKGVAIERKTVNDFISSMINKRLWKQLEELQQFKTKLLIIEGIDEQELYTDKELTGMNPNAIRGFLLSILLKYKIPIIFTKNYQDTAKFISVLSKKKNKELPLNISKRNLNKKERMQFILESFQGIGPKTAKKLLVRFNSLKNIFNASEEELKEVLGKKAESFKELLEKFY